MRIIVSAVILALSSSMAQAQPQPFDLSCSYTYTFVNVPPRIVRFIVTIDEQKRVALIDNRQARPAEISPSLITFALDSEGHSARIDRLTGHLGVLSSGTSKIMQGSCVKPKTPKF
jgi:hypothetical protein